VPASTRRFIIGAKGANLKQIEAISNTRVNFPRKEDEEFSYNDENSEEVVIVTIMGDAAGIRIAKEEIEKIVGEKVNEIK
jgi:rRNA processing protein Krr1/Pno1